MEENGIKMKEMMMERIANLIQNLEGKIPKGDDVGQGFQEDKDNFLVDQLYINKNTPRGFDSNNGSNQGWSPRGIQVPKIDMSKFDGKDPITWIFHMEQFFNIHQVPNLQKVTIASLYLEPQQFLRYQWICEHKNNTIISLSIFKEELITYHDDVKRNSFFRQLINLRKRGPLIEHTQQFQKLSLILDGIPNNKFFDLFIGTLKDIIQHEVCLFEPTSLDKDFMEAMKDERKNLEMHTKRTTFNTSRENKVPYSNPPQTTRLTLQQMDERRAKGLCFKFDNKDSKGCKCGEKKLI